MDFGGLQAGASLPTAMDKAYAGQEMVRMPTMKDRLALAVEQAERRLADAKRAKEIFDAHPDLEELLNIMQRGHF